MIRKMVIWFLLCMVHYILAEKSTVCTLYNLWRILEINVWTPAKSVSPGYIDCLSMVCFIIESVNLNSIQFDFLLIHNCVIWESFAFYFLLVCTWRVGFRVEDGCLFVLFNFVWEMAVCLFSSPLCGRWLFALFSSTLCGRWLFVCSLQLCVGDRCLLWLVVTLNFIYYINNSSTPQAFIWYHFTLNIFTFLHQYNNSALCLLVFLNFYIYFLMIRIL